MNSCYENWTTQVLEGHKTTKNNVPVTSFHSEVFLRSTSSLQKKSFRWEVSWGGWNFWYLVAGPPGVDADLKEKDPLFVESFKSIEQNCVWC
jgi:hypothetical protein